MNPYIPAMNEHPTTTTIMNDNVTFQRVEVLEFENLSPRTKHFPAEGAHTATTTIQAMNHPYIPAMNEHPTPITNDNPQKIKSVAFQRVEVLEFENLSPRTKHFPAASPASPQQRRISYDIDTFERSIRRTKNQVVDYLQEQIPKFPNRTSRRRLTTRQEQESCRSRSSINSSSSLREEQKEQRRKFSPAIPQRQRDLQTEELEAVISRQEP
jgi:hypothetical protein